MSDIEWKVLKSNEDAERAQLNKILADVRRTLYGGGGSTGGPGTTSNDTVTRNIEDQINAMAMAWRDTTARVLYYDNTIEAIAQDITYLNARIDDIEIGGGDAEAIQTLTARVIATEEGIIANSGFITDLSAAVFDPDTGDTLWARAVEDLSVTVDGINDTVMAMYSLDLDANGYIVGWKFTNDGTTGIVDFRTDRFKITAPGSTKGIEFADGIIMSVTPTHAYYQGVDFGGGGNFIAWFGPKPAAGPAGAIGANGVFWIRNNGQAYFGGGLSNEKVAELPVIVEHDDKIDEHDDKITTIEDQVTTIEDQVNDIIGQIGDLSGLPIWDITKAYAKGSVVRHNGNLYLAIQAVPAGTNITNVAYWDLVGNYSTLGEAIAYAIDKSETNTTELTTQAQRLSLLGAVNGANNAFILNQDTTRLSPTESLGQRLTSIQSNFNDTNARITSEVQALTAADAALASRVDVTQASLQAIRNVEDSSFELGTGWDLNFSPGSRFRRAGSNARTGSWRLEAIPGTGAASVLNNYEVPVEGGQKVRLSAWVTRNGSGIPPAGARFRLTVRQYRDDRSYLGIAHAVEDRTTDYFYKYYEGEVTVHEDTRFVRYQITTDGLTDGYWSFDDVALVPVTRAEQLLASDLSTVKTTVSNQGGTLSAHALRLDEQQTAIDSKASTSYVNQVKGEVKDYTDGKTEANLSLITTLDATVGGHTSQITQAMEVATSASAAIGTIANPSFEGEERAGWVVSGGAVISRSNPRTGAYSLRFTSNGDALNTQKIFGIRGGQTFRVGGWLRYTASRPNTWMRLGVRCYNWAGTYLRYKYLHVTEQQISTTWQKFSTSGVFEDDVSYVQFFITSGASLSTGQWLIDDVFFEPETNTLADMMAKYTLAVTAGGDVAGMQLLAGGGTSSIRFLADSFSIVAPGGGARTEFSNGNWRVYDASGNLVVRMGVW